MYLWATKDHYENETDEAERLVRPAPKMKPPRHDKRREDMESDRDPDTDGDPDLKGDPDLSLNYKNIGGSLLERVAFRYLVAKKKIQIRKNPVGPAKNVSVYDTKRKKVITVPETQVKNNPARYKPVEPKEKAKEEPQEPHGASRAEPDKLKGEHLKAEPEKPQTEPGKAKPEEAKPEEAKPEKLPGGVAKKELAAEDWVELQDSIKKFPDLARVVEFADPENSRHGHYQSIKDKPLKNFRQLAKLTFPGGVETIEDLVRAAKSPKPKEGGEELLPDEREDKKEPAKKEHKTPIKEPKPSRPKVSPEEASATLNAVIRAFPPDQAIKILRLHPTDRKAVLATFNEIQNAKLEKPEDFIEEVRSMYQTEHNKIGPPKTVLKGDKEVPFEELDESEQHEAWQRHRNKILALSLAAPALVAAEHVKNGVPKDLAQQLGQGALSGGVKPQSIYEHGLKSGLGKKIDPITGEEVPPKPHTSADVKKTLSALTDEGERKAAVAYFKAKDYQSLRAKYLDPSSDDSLNEFQTGSQILNGFKKADAEAKKLAGIYPKDVDSGIDVALDFRTRVMHRLNVLNPEKAKEAQDWVDKQDADDYDTLYKKWQREQHEVAKENNKRQRAHEKKVGQPYRDAGPVLLSDPPEPQKPLRYYEVRPKPSGRSSTKGLKSILGPVKLAHQVVHRFAFSTCMKTRAMAMSPRQAVYWGVEPYKETSPYPGWQQAHNRDLGDKDNELLLREARQWLKSPILSTAIEGIVPDTQYRAALDLAIRMAGDGRYSVGLHPATYNTLLARLAGESEKGTLLTVREAAFDSVYIRTLGEDIPMRASALIRKYATKFASSNPEVAFDLLDLATKVAEDEQAPAQEQEQQKQAQDQDQDQEQKGQGQQQKQGGEMPPALKEYMKKKKEKSGEKDEDQGQQQQKQAYAKLRSAVIHTAHQNPSVRQVLQPVLQIIKKLG
jgi:hypothetical protein